MTASYWNISDSDSRYFSRFLESRLPERIVDCGIYFSNLESSHRSGSIAFETEEQIENYASALFPEIKYEFIALPMAGKESEQIGNNHYITDLRTRFLMYPLPDWTMEKFQNLLSSPGLCGFNITYEDLLSENIGEEHLGLLNKHEKVLRISHLEKPGSADNYRNLIETCKMYPHLKFVIGGFGGFANVTDFNDFMDVLGSSLNDFYYDTHSVFDYDLFDAALGSIDSSRLIYSSAMPYPFAENIGNRESECVSNIYGQLKALLDVIGNDEIVKRKVFADNGESVYTLTQGKRVIEGSRVTLKDVAQASGYSLRTVKKVMGGKEYVSEKVKKKILAVGNELGYKKNKIASALARNQKHKIAVVYTETSKYFFPEIRTGFENCIQEYRDFGIEVEFFVDKESRSDFSARQVNMLKEIYLRKDIEGVVIHPFNSDELTLEINKLEESGKAVVTFVTDAPDSNRFCYVGSGGRKSGRIAAQLMGNYIGRKGKVFILDTMSTHWQSQNRKEGFMSKIRESYPEIVLEEPDFNGLLSNEEYYTYAKQMLSEKSIDGIFTMSANVYLIGQLLKDIGDAETPVIGFDLSEETRQLLKEGYVDVIIFQNPELEAYKSMKIICDYILEGTAPESRSVLTDVSIVTSECL